MFSSTRLLLPLVMGASLALASGCSSTENARGTRNQVSSLVRYGQFQEARDLALELLEQHPDDPRARRDLRDAEVALRLDRGIRQVFLDRVEGALVHFYGALELDPDNQVVQRWVQKANVQIAEDSLTLAASIAERKNPALKAATLQQVLSHLPVGETGQRIQRLRAKAIRGLISVQMFQAYELGGTYSTYQDGLRDLNRSVVAEGLGEQARSGITTSLEVLVSGVERRFIQARRYEQDELLLAARFEYGVVLSLEPGHLASREALTRIAPKLKDLELGVLQLPVLEQPTSPDLVQTEMEPAIEPEAEKPKPLAETPIPAAPNVSKEPARPSKTVKLAELYAEALKLEADGLLPASVEVYDEITRLRPHYEDVAERRETVAEFIIHAENLYTSAMDADDHASALQYLMRIAAFWPGYRDVREQIKSKKAALAAEDTDAEDSL